MNPGSGLSPFEDRGSGYHFAILSRHHTATLKLQHLPSTAHAPYQTVQGFQLPSLVTVTASTSETWYYDLTDCKAMTGITLNVGPPRR